MGPVVSGTASVSAVIGGEEVVLGATFSSVGISSDAVNAVSVLHIDGSGATRGYVDAFRSLGDFEEIVNGVGRRTLSEKELGEVSYILGRYYDDVGLYEVEVGPEIYAPFFQVKFGGSLYDSRSMGSGELSSLHVWWALNRAEDKQFVLIEEPEAFLSHSSQEALGNHIADVCIKKRLSVVMSSHSASIVGGAPDKSLVCISRSDGSVTVEADGPDVSLLKSLGVSIPVRCYLYVEDIVAKEFCLRILQKFSPKLARHCFVQDVGGEGQVKAKLKAMSDVKGPIAHIGVLDGDVDISGWANDALLAVSLPGTLPFEKQIRAVMQSHASEISKNLGVDDVNKILAHLQGLDHHEWLECLAKELSMAKTQIVSTVFRYWIEDLSVLDGANEMVSEIWKMLGER